VDERLSAALTARTINDLTSLTEDLPPEWQVERGRRAVRAAAHRKARDAVRPQIAIYLGVMAVLVAIWLIAGITAGAWYPWPIWPALGWGIALVARVRAAARPA
jgi:2TM domain